MNTPQVTALPGMTPLGLPEDPQERFIAYTLEFYGVNGIYKYDFTREEVIRAIEMYKDLEDTQFLGDTADREFVRDIVFHNRGE
jgi:hypothetical protein